MPERANPIHSELEDDAELREEIDQFVIGLAETVDTLQDAHGDADLSAVAQRCTLLRETATRLGFGPLADVAHQVSHACEDGKPEDAESALVDLTDLARRVRLGHRGAAG